MGVARAAVGVAVGALAQPESFELWFDLGSVPDGDEH
jgi:hypothetical protein